MLTRSKVKGALAGIAIGDALGMPVEGFTPEKIQAKYPNGVRKYEVPNGHKWFNGQAAGTTTDDTQLTIAVLKAIMEAGSFDLDVIAKYHVLATKENNNGWGRSTTESIRRLANGVHWKESGITSEPKRGTGNGAPMKVLPLAIWFSCCGMKEREGFNQKLVDFSAMTHYTKMSAYAAIVHTHILTHCLLTLSKNYTYDWNLLDTLNYLFGFESESSSMYPDDAFSVKHLNDVEDDFELQLDKLRDVLKESWDSDRIHKEFGGGSYYVFHSLPFTYAHWIRNNKTIDILYEVIEGGGDTDSNGSMIASMLGALHGIEFFEAQKHLMDLKIMPELMGLADQFCNLFGIP